MLQENETVIEFCPGSKWKELDGCIDKFRENDSPLVLLSTSHCIYIHFLNLTSLPLDRTESIAGRIVVHDRAYVESEILPRYFNHSSFASLRRQLNYFAFSREGKGKQKGATYSNDLVFDMQDILLLKRRLPGATAPLNPSVRNPMPPTQLPSLNIQSISATKSLKKDSRSKSRRSAKHKKKNRKVQKILDSVVPVVHVSSKRTSSCFHHASSTDTVDVEMYPKAPSSTVSPPPAEIITSKDESASQIVLDLTKPETAESEESSSHQSAGSKNNNSSISSIRSSWNYQPIAISRNVSFQLPYSELGMNTTSLATDDDTKKKEADVLAGCNALLSLGWQTQASS